MKMKQATAEAPQSHTGALTFIFFVVLLDLIGMTILAPVAAFVVRQYSTEALMVSMLTVIYAAALWIGRLIPEEILSLLPRRLRRG
jgi:uncharacterized membrane protein